MYLLAVRKKTASPYLLDLVCLHVDCTRNSYPDISSVSTFFSKYCLWFCCTTFSNRSGWCSTCSIIFSNCLHTGKLALHLCCRSWNAYVSMKNRSLQFYSDSEHGRLIRKRTTETWNALNSFQRVRFFLLIRLTQKDNGFRQRTHVMLALSSSTFNNDFLNVVYKRHSRIHTCIYWSSSTSHRQPWCWMLAQEL